MSTAARAPSAPRPRPAPRRALPAWALGLASTLGVLALLELLVRAGLIPERSFPPMSEALATLGEQLGEGSFWTAVAQTLQGWALGLLVAVAIAVPLGVLLGSSETLYRALRVPIEFLRPVPSVALIPLAVLVYGTGLESKVFLVAFAATWPLLVQTLYGVRDVDPVARDTARAYGLTARETLTRVVVPSALPYVVTGLRISAAVALILAVTAELVIGSPGLGQAINLAQSGGNVELMYALIIVTGIIGWALNALLSAGERRVLHWHPSQRRAR